MATEYVVGDSIVASLTIKAPAPPATIPSPEPWFRSLAQLLRTVCLPKEDDVKLFDGRAYYPVYANNLDPKYSCSWTENGRRRRITARSFWPGPTSPDCAFVSKYSSSSPRTAAGRGLPSTITRPL